MVTAKTVRQVLESTKGMSSADEVSKGLLHSGRLDIRAIVVSLSRCLR